MGGLAQSMPLMEDDEQVATRYSSVKQRQVLLVREAKSSGAIADLLLADGSQVSVDANKRDFGITKKLHMNLVLVPAYLLSSFSTSFYLRKHIYGEVAVLCIQENGQLRDQGGMPTPLAYDDERGVYVSEGVPLERSGHTEEEFYELDW